jgi:hypothetical protein
MTTPDRYDLAGLLSSLPQGRLERRRDLSMPEWSFWQYRNLSFQRVVGLWQPDRAPTTAEQLGASVRSIFGRHFPRAWWRDLAFGIVVQVDEISISWEDAADFIDVREHADGFWRWLVLVLRSKHALGIHSWTEAYLSPLYRALTRRLAAAGMQVTRVRRERDGRMKTVAVLRPPRSRSRRDSS